MTGLKVESFSQQRPLLSIVGITCVYGQMGCYCCQFNNTPPAKTFNQKTRGNQNRARKTPAEAATRATCMGRKETKMVRSVVRPTQRMIKLFNGRKILRIWTLQRLVVADGEPFKGWYRTILNEMKLCLIFSLHWVASRTTTKSL